MRSGTTSLARYLGTHPQLYVASNKELHFFDIRYDLGVDWYRSHFADAGPDQLAGEATPVYMYDQLAPARMAELIPDARLVVSLRDPVDRAYSHYWMRHERKQDELPDFAAAVAAEPRRLAANESSKADMGYLARGRYLWQLERLAQLYPRDRIHVLLFEDLRDHPAREYTAVTRFLGVDDHHVPDILGAKINGFQKLRSPKLRTLTLRKHPLLRKVVARVNTVDAEYPPIDPELRRRLVDELADERRALERWLDRDLSIWAR
jgi:Sulfotransferase domain